MAEKRTITVAGKQIRMLVGGSGPGLLYLHSAGADVEWLESHERLAARFTVHVPAHPGFAARTARITWLKCSAPPSGRSSRSTLVITTWRRPRRAAASATWAGSSASTPGRGSPLFTLQNPQRRVHVSPRIMNVAVPAFQHS